MGAYKDRETGQLVEWEGGLNPLYEDQKQASRKRDNEEKQIEFKTFQEAKEWAINNPGKSFSRAPDGIGFVTKSKEKKYLNTENTHIKSGRDLYNIASYKNRIGTLNVRLLKQALVRLDKSSLIFLKSKLDEELKFHRAQIPKQRSKKGRWHASTQSNDIDIMVKEVIKLIK